MSKKKKKLELDEFHYHEAFDRSYMVANILEDNLINHIVFKKEKHLKKKLKKAQEIIYNVYLEVGGLQMTLFTDPSELPDFMKDKEK